jgi:hypothetical protein
MSWSHRSQDAEKNLLASAQLNHTCTIYVNLLFHGIKTFATAAYGELSYEVEQETIHVFSGNVYKRTFLSNLWVAVKP